MDRGITVSAGDGKEAECRQRARRGSDLNLSRRLAPQNLPGESRTFAFSFTAQPNISGEDFIAFGTQRFYTPAGIRYSGDLLGVVQDSPSGTSHSLRAAERNVEQKAFKLFTLVKVHWEDSAHSVGWKQPGRDGKYQVPNTGKVWSLGFVVESNEKVLTISNCVGESGAILSPLSIPWGCIDVCEELSARTVGNDAKECDR